MNQFPQLPNDWIPNVVVPFGDTLIAYYQNGKYSHQFTWDKVSVTFNEHRVTYLHS